MFQFRITNIVVCRFPQITTYIAPSPLIILHLHGLHWHRSDALNLTRPAPGFFLYYPGQISEYEYDGTRENWVVFLESDGLRRGSEAGTVEVNTGHCWCKLPGWSQFSSQKIAGWRNEFFQMRELLSDPSPISQLRLQTGVANILRAISDSGADRISKTPAAQLKNLLDEDRSFERSLSEFSSELGYSVDHLRRLFEKEYGLSPIAYRNQRRAEQANVLLANSTLRVKEVAHLLGFQNPGQFAVFFRKHFGISPVEAIQRYRFGTEHR